MNDDPRHERFMRFFLEHEPELLRTVLVYVPSRADARDILQETAVALWRNFEQYDPSRPFVNWACGYARIEVKRFLRKSQRLTLLSERAVEALLAIESRITDESDARRRALQTCLDGLPSEQRLLIREYYLEEKSVSSLAVEANRTVEAVYKALQRIRGKLLQCIERKLMEA